MDSFTDSLTIEIPVGVVSAPGVGAQVPFGKQDYLQSYIGGQTVFIHRIEAYNNRTLAVSPVTIANPTVNVTDFINITVTLNVAGKDRYKDIPLARLNNMRMDTAPDFAPSAYEPFGMKNSFQVNWPQCYLRFLAAPTTPTPFSVLLGIFFTYQHFPDEVSE